MSKLIDALCSSVNKGGSKESKVRDSRKGVSVQSYLQGSGNSTPAKRRVLDSAHNIKLTCSLFSMPRADRRRFLSRVSDSVRRQILEEGRKIKKRLVDSCVEYDPELCWAIQHYIDFSDPSAEEILTSRLKNKTLPDEVKEWFVVSWTDVNSEKAKSLEAMLKPYRLFDSSVKDDKNLDNYLSEGLAQEDKLDTIVEDKVKESVNLSEEAQKTLDEISESVTEKTKSFIEAIVEEVKDVVPTIAAENSTVDVEEEVEEAISEDPVEGSEEEDEEEEEIFGSDKVGDSTEITIGSRVMNGDKVYDVIGIKNGVILAREADADPVMFSEDEVLVVTEASGVEGDTQPEPIADPQPEPVVDPQPEPVDPYAGFSEESFSTLEDTFEEENKIADSIIEDAEGIPTELIKQFEEGDKFNIPYKIVNTSISKGFAGLGSWRLNVEVDREVPKSLRESISKKIEKVAEESGVSVKVKFPMSESNKFSIISKGALKDSVDLAGTEPVDRQIPVGSVVYYDSMSWKVVKSGDSSISLKALDGSNEIEVPSEFFQDIYIYRRSAKVKDSEESEGVRDVIFDWVIKDGSSLATEFEELKRYSLFEDLVGSLLEIDPEFELAEDKVSILYSGNSFLEDTGSTLLVGGVAFVYTSLDSGVESMASQVADTAKDLYESYTVQSGDEVTEVEEEIVQDSENLRSALDALRSGSKVCYSTIEDAEGEDSYIIVMQDIFGRDRKYVTETGETDDRDLAMRFNDKRTAFNHMKKLANEGKLTHSIFNSAPIRVKDDSDVLSEEAKAEVVKKVEEQILEKLKEQGVEIQDSAEEETLEEVQKRIEEAESETETDLTDEQKESGDYKKGHVTIQGLDIAIENPKGSVRSGVDADGNPWSTEMKNTYGYFEGTKGVDSDDVDCFLGPNPLSKDVFVVDQLKEDGSFDEHKVMFGFDSSEEAREAYLSNYSEDWKGLGDITKIGIEDFKKWVTNPEVREKPFTEYLKVTDSMDPNEDKDDSVILEWDTDRLMEYLNALSKKSLTKEQRKALKLKDDATEEDLEKVNSLIKETLIARGVVDPSDHGTLPVVSPIVSAGGPNPYDMSHNATTFHKVRNTEEVLANILGLISKTLGREVPLTVSEYGEIVSNGSEDPVVGLVSDSVLSMGELDLICPALYKRKFTDSVWIADTAECLSDCFSVDIPEEIKGVKVIVSSKPFSDSVVKEFVVDSSFEYPFDGEHSLYVATFKKDI